MKILLLALILSVLMSLLVTAQEQASGLPLALDTTKAHLLTRFEFNTRWNRLPHWLSGFRHVYAQDADGQVYDVIGVTADPQYHNAVIVIRKHDDKIEIK